MKNYMMCDIAEMAWLPVPCSCHALLNLQLSSESIELRVSDAAAAVGMSRTYQLHGLLYGLRAAGHYTAYCAGHFAGHMVFL
jgi:hypothetical protein